MIAAILARLAAHKLAIAAAAGLAVAVLGFGAGWTINGWRLGAELAGEKAARAQDQAAHAGAALATLQADAAVIHQAATEYAGIKSTLAPKIAALTKELRNAPRLPADCRPDAVRVRNLDAAIDAANQAAAAR